MPLPNPLPDNPLKWDGWKAYNSANYYSRLCLDYSSNASNELIEENCRQLLVWWQKKLPLKNQPSNPLAQILRQGLDEAPQYLAEARTRLLDPAQRMIMDAQLRDHLIESAIDEFRKLLSFTLADRRLTPEGEQRLRRAGHKLGLSDEDMAPVIEAEMARIKAVRVNSDQIILPVAPMPSVAIGSEENQAVSPVEAAGNPAAEFRRLLKMSRLCQNGEDMTDDQRDAMCNMGESLGLTGGEAEDLIDEYLEAAMIDSAKQMNPPKPTLPVRGGAAQAALHTMKAVQPSVQPIAKPKVIATTPAARAAERQKYTNFVSPTGMEMYLIPSGEFMMGAEGGLSQQNEQPKTPVTVGCFYMARFPISNLQYERFDPTHRNKRAAWADDRHPVIYVTWNDAVAFCKWLSTKEGRRYRLTTEAEWEYAARGGDVRIFPWGNDLSAGNLANFADVRTLFTWRDTSIDDGFAETSPLGSFPRGASPFGIEDLAGNVLEWCQDWFEPYRGKPQINPQGPPSGKNRVYRGGSWRSRAASIRATARNSNIPTYMGNDVGFRVVCDCE